MFLIFFLVWYFIGFPIFKHKRPGLNNKIFTLYKFKTLFDSSNKKFNRKRISQLGVFLRRTNLDELPQLINILKNDMSFVGPRPLLVDYLNIKEFRIHKRSKCKPGITGLAQTKIYKNSYNKKRKSKWIDQFYLDLKYSENISLKMDLYILYKTFIVIISKKKTDYLNETKLLSEHLR